MRTSSTPSNFIFKKLDVLHLILTIDFPVSTGYNRVVPDEVQRKESEVSQMKYRIRSIEWPMMIIEDGFSSARAAASWAEDNMHFGGIWAGGWTIEEYED